MVEIVNDTANKTLVSHPGDTLLELLEQNSVSQQELALKIGTSEKYIDQIIKGKRSINVSFAKKLEKVFSLDASFWINRQAIYEEKLKK